MENLSKLSVSELTHLLKNMIEESFFNLDVEGEISGFKPATSGHIYFSLKDNDALINAVIWRSTAQKLNFIPQDGQKVIVHGSINIYPPRGSYQIVCTSIKPAGDGYILAKLEERKRYYATKGYFDENQKKPIPKNPETISVVTSPTGAALQDILQITGRRNTAIKIVIFPAMVQGDEAAQTIAKRIAQINKANIGDVIIVGRGGGSLEDLLPFSEDCVIEAIHDSKIPVISAVGHEIDWALSDFVADLRAPTPSAAAELVCQSQFEQKQQLISLITNISESIHKILNRLKLKQISLKPENFKYIVENKLSQINFKLDKNIDQMKNVISEQTQSFRTRLDIASAKIDTSSPRSIMKRGYSIVCNQNGKTIKSAKNLQINDIIKIRFAQGSSTATLKEINNEN